MFVYHIAKFANLEAIQNQGLRSDMPSIYKHVGSGIYVFFDKRYYNEIIEYIGTMASDKYRLVLIITIEVNENDLLMDEDSLIIDYDELDKLRSIMPQEAYERYIDYLDNIGCADIPAIDNPHFGKWKTNLIDKYKIRPNNLFKTDCGRQNIMTARCPYRVIDPTNIEILFDNGLHDVEELDRIMVAVQMDDYWGNRR